MQSITISKRLSNFRFMTCRRSINKIKIKPQSITQSPRSSDYKDQALGCGVIKLRETSTVIISVLNGPVVPVRGKKLYYARTRVSNLVISLRKGWRKPNSHDFGLCDPPCTMKLVTLPPPKHPNYTPVSSRFYTQSTNTVCLYFLLLKHDTFNMRYQSSNFWPLVRIPFQAPWNHLINAISSTHWPIKVIFTHHLHYLWIMLSRHLWWFALSAEIGL